MARIYRNHSVTSTPDTSNKVTLDIPLTLNIPNGHSSFVDVAAPVSLTSIVVASLLTYQTNLTMTTDVLEDGIVRFRFKNTTRQDIVHLDVVVRLKIV